MAAAVGAADSSAILLPLAGGRGNDAVRRLGIDLDPVKAIRAIGVLRVNEADLGLVNGRPYLGVANLGFDGLANLYGNGAKLNLRSFTYHYGGLERQSPSKIATHPLPDYYGPQHNVPGLR